MRGREEGEPVSSVEGECVQRTNRLQRRVVEGEGKGERGLKGEGWGMEETEREER